MSSCVAGPPLEEHLASNTLWPEIIKLYGHGSDLFALAASPDGAVLASACKAQIVPQAAIWLWDTNTWQPLGNPLEVNCQTHAPKVSVVLSGPLMK